MAPRQHNVGPPWKVLALQPEAVTHRMQHLADRHLGLGVPAPDGRHVAAARLGDIREVRTGQLARGGRRWHGAAMGSTGIVREHRWAVITADGRHAWLGRHSDPTDAELAEVARQLEAAGDVAWLAVTEGGYYQPADAMQVLLVRPLAGAGGDWEAAKAAFLGRRAETLKAG